MYNEQLAMHMQILQIQTIQSCAYFFTIFKSENIIKEMKFGEASMKQYEILSEIDKGAYGEVYKAKDKHTNEIVALKKIQSQAKSIGIASTTLRQITLLRQLKDIPNIIKIKNVVWQKQHMYLIFDFMEQDLKRYIQTFHKKGQYIPQSKIKKLMLQLITGISQCHTRRIIHRDLKPANLLIDKEQSLKIGDFGLARTFSIPTRPYSQGIVTLWYRAPQVLLGSMQYGPPIDIWSIGCIFAELIEIRPLFPGTDDIDQLNRIFRTLGTPNQQIWPGITKLKKYNDKTPNFKIRNVKQLINNKQIEQEGIKLLQALLCYDPDKRITAKEALQHPYFAN